MTPEEERKERITVLENAASLPPALQHAMWREYAEKHGVTGREAFEMYTDANANVGEKWLALRTAIDADYEARLKLEFCTSLLKALMEPPA